MKISQHYFTFPFYIPRICGYLKNWPLYLSNYLLRKRQPAEYQLRNGHRLLDATGTLAGTFAVVFVRREYGVFENFKTIVEVGANMGCFTVYAADSCPQARIFSYEPEKRNFKVLSENINSNSFQDRVKAFNCAVASKFGEMELHVGESPLNSLYLQEGTKTSYKVPCTTLADIMQEHKLEQIDFLKLNCEGAEYGILHSCSADVFKRIKNIRLEYHTMSGEGENGRAIERFLEDNGYAIERFTSYRDVSGFIWASRK